MRLAPALLSVLCATLADAAATLSFNRDVRPILSDRCYGCHGPDSNKGRKAGLRLDEPAGATKELKSGERAIIPGDIENSEMVRRMLSTDPDEIMPPPELDRPLTKEQRDVLIRWIREGAKYEPHWAFVPPTKSAPPAAGEGWALDPIDRFVAAAADKAGLQPRPEADRATLLRRLHLSVTGLPPSPEETDAFLADKSPDAYARRVDTLLASPRAAEHQAVAWLDLSRYADTWGYTGDKPMFAWPWRDWVLNAIRSNMPYDRFITEQVAGDMLPDATQSTRVATAFNRIHRMTYEGGSIAEEFRQDGIADRVATAGYAFLSLTLDCAKCHDHKYDPISQRDFFAMAAMFGDLDENGLLDFHGAQPSPVMRLYTPDEEAREKELIAAVRQAEARHSMSVNGIRPDAPLSTVALPAPEAHYPFESLTKTGVENVVPGGKPATFERARGDQLGQVELCEGVVGKGLSFDGDGGLMLAGLEKFDRFTPFTLSAHVRLGEKNSRATLLHGTGFYTGEGDASGLELLIDKGRLRWSAIHLWPGSAASVETEDELPVGRWFRLTVTYDGSSEASGLRIYLDGRSVKSSVLRDSLDAPFRLNLLELGSRSRDSGFRNGKMDEVKIWRTALTAAEVAVEHGIAPTSLETAVADDHRLRREWKPWIESFEALRAARRALNDHQAKAPEFSVMRRSKNAPPTFVLTRGEYDKPDKTKPVSAGAPEAVLAWDPALPRDRLGLARWLTHPNQPLTSRVLVNRVWTQLFGQGLVTTGENFGLMGDLPTHQEVLDTLASDFVQGGWDVRALMRRILLSATFRQDSTPSKDHREKDPSNRLLARGPVVRLPAETLRDQALQAGGLLKERFCGASVQEHEPYRSVYVFRKRTAPPDSMLIFDAGSRETCQPKRLTTNTPLQALVLLNNPTFVSAAAGVARRAAAAGQDDDARITFAFRLLCGRAPEDVELTALRDLLRQRRAEFAADLVAAGKVLGIKPTPPPPAPPKGKAAKDKKNAAEPKDAIPPKAAQAPAPKGDPDIAALALVASTIMASDAFVTSR